MIITQSWLLNSEPHLSACLITRLKETCSCLRRSLMGKKKTTLLFPCLCSISSVRRERLKCVTEHVVFWSDCGTLPSHRTCKQLRSWTGGRVWDVSRRRNVSRISICKPHHHKKKSLRGTLIFQELKTKVKIFHQTWRKEDISRYLFVNPFQGSHDLELLETPCF